MTYITLGGGPLGNLFSPVEEVVARGAVERAWERGVRHFDTAPHYGLGLSESRIGGVLAELPRGDFKLSTKVGRLLVDVDEGSAGASRSNVADTEGFAVTAGVQRRWDFSADGIRRCLESSLTRLGLSRVDTVYIHDPDDDLATACDEAYPALVELRRCGVIDAVGLGTNSVEVAATFIDRCPIDALMLAGRTTLLDQSSIERVLPTCAEKGIAVIAAGVFNSGILADAQLNTTSTFDYAPAPAPVIARAAQIAQVCRDHGSSTIAAALALPGLHRAVTSVCFGARSAAEVDANLDAVATRVPDALWEELVTQGLLDRRMLDPPAPRSFLEGAC